MEHTFKALILAAGLLTFLPLSSTISAQTLSDLELTWARLWRVELNRHGAPARADKFDRDSSDELRPSKDELMRASDPTMISEAEVAASNKGFKAIKAITWEHAYFSDEAMSRVLSAYRFHSKTKIRPGETKLVRARANVSVQTVALPKSPCGPHRVRRWVGMAVPLITRRPNHSSLFPANLAYLISCSFV